MSHLLCPNLGPQSKNDLFQLSAGQTLCSRERRRTEGPAELHLAVLSGSWGSVVCQFRAIKHPVFLTLFQWPAVPVTFRIRAGLYLTPFYLAHMWMFCVLTLNPINHPTHTDCERSIQCYLLPCLCTDVIVCSWGPVFDSYCIVPEFFLVDQESTFVQDIILRECNFALAPVSWKLYNPVVPII